MAGLFKKKKKKEKEPEKITDNQEIRPEEVGVSETLIEENDLQSILGDVMKSSGFDEIAERIEELENIQYFHAGDKILDTIVGIVAGMSYTFSNRNKPIIAFAENEDGIKVSARATKNLVEMGIHLANAIKIAAEKVGGIGGGHNIAAGATIPKGSENEFLKILDEIIGKQKSQKV